MDNSLRHICRGPPGKHIAIALDLRDVDAQLIHRVLRQIGFFLRDNVEKIKNHLVFSRSSISLNVLSSSSLDTCLDLANSTILLPSSPRYETVEPVLYILLPKLLFFCRRSRLTPRYESSNNTNPSCSSLFHDKYNYFKPRVKSNKILHLPLV